VIGPGEYTRTSNGYDENDVWEVTLTLTEDGFVRDSYWTDPDQGWEAQYCFRYTAVLVED